MVEFQLLKGESVFGGIHRRERRPGPSDTNEKQYKECQDQAIYCTVVSCCETTGTLWEPINLFVGQFILLNRGNLYNLSFVFLKKQLIHCIVDENDYYLFPHIILHYV
jgi:hypothetical protein